jgi:uncharacterized protein YchJ
MGDALRARFGGRRWTETRLGRIILFLGIVWSVSGAFLVLETGLPALLAVAVGRGWVGTELFADGSSSKLGRDKAAALRCATAAPNDVAAVADASALQRARHAAFQMGRNFGIAAGATYTDLGTQPDQLAQLLQEVREQAAALGVPVPELPAIRHMATAMIEFSANLELDDRCTASRLASRYAPAHGHLYQLGAVVGYAAIGCANGICGTFRREIRQYGELAGVPEPLWRPMVQGSLDTIPGANAREKTFWILAALDRHIGTGQ